MKYFLSFLILSVLIVTVFNLAPTSTHAQYDEAVGGLNNETSKNGFVPLVGIPYVNTKDTNLSLAGYVDALYKAAISIAAFMAVVKIIFAGVKYMLSDVVTSKEDAKKDIRGALIGLLIVIGAVLILNTINPQLKGLRALDGPPVNVELYSYEGTAATQISLKCAEYGEGNCSKTSCSYFTNSDTVLGWLGSWTGGITETIGTQIGAMADSGADAVLCSSVCAIRGGTTIGGSCIYPENYDAYINNITEIETTVVNEYLITPDTVIFFTSTPFSSSGVKDARRENGSLIGLTENDFVGYLTSDWYSDEGKSVLAEYNNDYEIYEQEVLRPACGTDNKLIREQRPLGKVSYFCIK